MPVLQALQRAIGYVPILVVITLHTCRDSDKIDEKDFSILIPTDIISSAFRLLLSILEREVIVNECI